MGRDTVNIVTDGAVLSETPPLRVDKPQFAGFGYLDPTLLEDRDGTDSEERKGRGPLQRWAIDLWIVLNLWEPPTSLPASL